MENFLTAFANASVLKLIARSQKHNTRKKWSFLT